MKKFCSTRFTNHPFGDPGLFVSFLFEKRALMFDLGEIYSLSHKDIIKIDHVFVTHTHIDHFTGFDRLIRIMLGRDKNIYLFGPKGFVKNIEGKLAGYSWNLVENYTADFTIHVKELRKEKIISRKYICKKKFLPIYEPDIERPDVICEENSFSISAKILSHGIDCIGYSMHEKFHINIIKEALTKKGLDTGPWLSDFKKALYERYYDNKKKNDFTFTDNSGKEHTFDIDKLAKEVAIITEGKKIAYISDVEYTPKNIKQITELASDVDQIFIEAAFLHREKDIAKQKKHLTAKQAGIIAKEAGAKRLTVFHFSTRYTGKEELLVEEAQKAFRPEKT